MEKSQTERRDILKKIIKANNNSLKINFQNQILSFSLEIAEHKWFTTNQEKEIMDYLQDVCDRGYEGLMMKSTIETSVYKPQSRIYWIKLKKFLLKAGQIGDTLDLVPLAVYQGKGKRSKFFGAYLLGSFNKQIQKYEVVCKLGTGFSDEVLEQLTTHYQKKQQQDQQNQFLVTERPNYVIANDKIKPDFWIQKPDQVWEIQFDSFSQSPLYTIGKVGDFPGISLRFPRLVKVRDDKDVKQATNVQELIEFAKQDKNIKISKYQKPVLSLRQEHILNFINQER
ncbi:Nucleic acid-binding, OB-fold [Pseudocohnilembus persalinus]|uniref:Nucleic acid-binding, OB-fold n=1 Tax=Pseudocohnilembus persalinus TaxID=266149 RepID=A0A0V0QJV5_PSEPJ|nr:Nucleic acid-binding, OB-fold [Pseudocohnilembus persalinus]|eukprot:KRX02486.1 Nucleic acid-binding, OB-fold [Pseudocohnilembus persalinus]